MAQEVPQPPGDGSPAGPVAWSALGQSHATRRRRRRQSARERIHGWVVHPIDTPHLLQDPIVHPVPALSSAFTVARLVAIAVALHGLMLVVAFGASALVGKASVYKPPERVQLRIVEQQPEPEAEPEPEPEPTADLRPEFEQPPEPEPEPEKPPPRVKPKVEKAPPPAAELPEPPKQRRRVVGLSLESTVVGGAGPAFAVGSTRMGKTRRRADDPEKAKAATGTGGPGSEVGSDSGPVKGNRVASRLPTGNAPIVAPRRLSAPKPVYPPLLKEQGIEGEVVLLATIDARGRVTGVEVVSPAPQPEFNLAAVKAAKRGRWSPATRGGRPMVFSQSYTVRFRIND